jgi:hypothetical protein
MIYEDGAVQLGAYIPSSKNKKCPNYKTRYHLPAAIVSYLVQLRTVEIVDKPHLTKGDEKDPAFGKLSELP